jgi:hypothetical protein
MCGAKHTEGNIAPTDYVRTCVQKGAKYALVVDDKVYTLKHPQHLGSSRAGGTQQAGLGTGQSHGHSEWRYHLGESVTAAPK